MYDYLKLLADHIATKTVKSTKTALNGLLTATSFALQRKKGTMLVRRCQGLTSNKLFIIHNVYQIPEAFLDAW
jgi:hypothetical protein